MTKYLYSSTLKEYSLVILSKQLLTIYYLISFTLKLFIWEHNYFFMFYVICILLKAMIKDVWSHVKHFDIEVPF